MFTPLTRISVKSTIILEASIEDSWTVCKQWGRQPWLPLLPDGTSFDVQVLDGMSENEVGAVRCSKFGGGTRIFERLVAVDEDLHRMRWQATAHEDTISPFEEASFINFNTSLTLTAVTMGGTTFAEWLGECYTDPQYAMSMRQTFEAWYVFGMLSLKEYMARYRRSKQAKFITSSNKGPYRFEDDIIASQGRFSEDSA